MTITWCARRHSTELPVAAYNVSGGIVITCHAKEATRWLRQT